MSSSDEYAHQIETRANTFVCNKYRKLMKVNFLLAILAVLLSVVFIYFSIRHQEAKYYGSTTTGLQIPLSSLSDPVLNEKIISGWSSVAVKKTYELDFSQDNSQIEAMKTYFTSAGWAAYQAALKKSGIIDAVKQDKLEVSSIVVDDPVVLKTGVSYGVRYWTVQMPVLIAFSSASDYKGTNSVITIKIVRSNDLAAPSGLQIESFSAT